MESVSHSHHQIFEQVRSAASRLRATTASERKKKLQRLEKTLLSMAPDIGAALEADFGKPFEEALLTDVSPVVIEIRHAIRELGSWMKSKRVGFPRVLLGSTSFVRYEPKGPSLIIAPWNYAFTLTLGPIVSAVAAGCPVVVKPSEYTPEAGQVLIRLVEETFAPDEVAVCLGDRRVAESLLNLPFRHIYFTGSPRIGKKVMAAAANHLASVTLELGGKSPAVVDATADIGATAKRIVFGKFANSGQTCIAPDYVLAHESVVERLKSSLVGAIRELYGNATGATNPPKDLSRIISREHAERLVLMMEEAVDGGASIFYGGSCDIDNRYVEPTIMTNVSPTERLMTEEIFGPVLPIVPFDRTNDAVDLIAGKNPPLCLYLFSTDKSFISSFVDQSEAGCISINETLLHFSNPSLPFGGLTTSGVGRAHGHAGFLAFSNEKAVFKQPFGPWLIKHIHPPFGEKTRSRLRALIRIS